jgi:hypothetical protein
MRDNFIYVSKDRWEKVFCNKEVPGIIEHRVKVMGRGIGEEDVWCGGNGGRKEEEDE